MRLISVHKHELRWFIGDKIPSFAILSHTWGDDEVTFEDMQNGEGLKKPAYSKITYTCQQAAKDGLEWAWVDTCCIDKSSSAELSEAINSMYSWYQQASRCYAYLSDVVGDGDLEDSRWFTRGWTLQELIAPSVVDFFDHEWRFIGDRVDLAERIHKITGIPSKLLHREAISERDEFNRPVRVSLSDYSVAQRMSWASRRSCTRVEDVAYCLLGLFDVNMPLLYGEGWKAFTRLQELIYQETNDLSLLAWTVPGDGSDARLWSPCGVLASSPADFLHSSNVVSMHHHDDIDESSWSRLGLSLGTLVYPHDAYTLKSHLHGMAYDAFIPCTDESDEDQASSVVIRMIPVPGANHINGGPKSFYRLGTPSIQSRSDGMYDGKHWKHISIRKNVTESEIMNYKRTPTSLFIQGLPVDGPLGRNGYDCLEGPYEYRVLDIKYPDCWDEMWNKSGIYTHPDLPTRNSLWPHLAVVNTGRWCQWDRPWACFRFTDVPCPLASEYICVTIGWAEAGRLPFYMCFACDNWQTFYFGLCAERPPEGLSAVELGFSSCPFPRGDSSSRPAKAPVIHEQIFVDDLKITATVELENPTTPEGEAAGFHNHILVIFQFERIEGREMVYRPNVGRLPGNKLLVGDAGWREKFLTELAEKEAQEDGADEDAWEDTD